MHWVDVQNCKETRAHWQRSRRFQSLSGFSLFSLFFCEGNLSVFIMEPGLSGMQSISSELMRTVEGGKEAKERIKWGLDWMQRVWFSRQLVCDSGGQDKGRSTSSGSQRDAGAPDHHKSSFKVQTSDQRKRTPGRIFFFFFLKPTADTPEAGGPPMSTQIWIESTHLQNQSQAPSIFHHRRSLSLAITASSFRTFSSANPPFTSDGTNTTTSGLWGNSRWQREILETQKQYNREASSMSPGCFQSSAKRKMRAQQTAGITSVEVTQVRQSSFNTISANSTTLSIQSL